MDSRSGEDEPQSRVLGPRVSWSKVPSYGRTADYVNIYIILSGSGFGVQGSPGTESTPEHLPSIPEHLSISYLAVESSPRLL